MDSDKVKDGLVISMEYTLTVDGEVLDSSKEDGPLEFLQGYQNIIPGLESEITGMTVGESKEVTVAPADGYGEVDPADVKDISLEEFPGEIPVEVGVELEMHDEDEQLVRGTIIAVEEDVVKMDFNHPLAGKELFFAVKIVGLRPATGEELSHGHVHSHGHNH